jgi:hypothetical protein
VILALCFTKWNAFRISCFVQPFLMSPIIRDCSGLSATAQLLFEPGRLRPHPSLRDYGLQVIAGRPTSIVSALMIFTGCLENIAGPNHNDAQENTCFPSQ